MSDQVAKRDQNDVPTLIAISDDANQYITNLLVDPTTGRLLVSATGGGGGSGTVTSVSVVTANGLSGSVATATTTPAITLDISGLDATKIANGSVSSTEFQYLDGVTSSIQTQLNAKGSGTVTGSGAATQVAFWSSASVLTGNSGFIFDTGIASEFEVNIGRTFINDVLGNELLYIRPGTAYALGDLDGAYSGNYLSMSDGVTPTVTFSKLAGTGTQMIVASSTGVLSRQAITTGTVTSVATGTGITGGTITSTGTIALSTPLQPIASFTGNSLKYLRVNAGETAVEYTTISGTGDVVGPGSAADNAIPRFDGTTGKLIQNSAILISDDSGTNVNITTIDRTTPAQITIQGGSATSGNNFGASVELVGGVGSGTRDGGLVNLFGGQGGATGIGGGVEITAGDGGDTSGDGGGMVFNAGNATSGNGGDMTISAGNATSGNGGNFTLYAGSGIGGNAGNIQLNAGNASSGNINGGTIYQYGGGGVGSGSGGSFSVQGGVGGATGIGGGIQITGGFGGGTSGKGGDIDLIAGMAQNGNSNGGNLNLYGGRKNGAGADGHITLYANSNGALGAVLDLSLIASTNKTFIFPNASGTFALLGINSSQELFDHFASVGNVGTGEDDLYSDTVAAGQLATNGDKIECEYGGTFVSSATATREVKLYFGGTAIFDTGTLTLSLSSAWTAYVTFIRVSSSVIRYMVSFATEGAALSAYTAVGELTGLTLANTQVIKITGEAAGVGAATNDIVAMMGNIEFKPHA